jgi:thiol-disulfide isomerase/thioredoxin
VCGFFSSTAERPAYGCYPENRDKDNVGHSFRFLEALAAGYDFPAAHAHTLVTDNTPDVPLRTSDVYLERLLREAADARGLEFEAYVDDLLARAWQDKAAWEPEIRLLDRIGQAFGYFSPRSAAELRDQAKLLPDLSEQFRSYGNAWKLAQGDLAAANLQRFLTDEPAWQERVGTDGLPNLNDDARRSLTHELLAELVPYTREDTVTAERLVFLRERADSTAAARYRMQVRLGVVLRMQGVLTSIAGRVHLASEATEEERKAHVALLRCEDLHLDPGDSPATLPMEREPFPSYDDELELAKRTLPGWMGIRFRQASPEVRRRFTLANGAAAVVAVYPESPAKKAGLDVGDVILGPPGNPFTEPHQIREWVMTSEVGTPAPINVLREERIQRVALVPEHYPLKWPSLPGPPKVGSKAPAVGPLSAYRDTLPPQLARGGPFLLFFWATWCAPCKASLPEVVAFERERHIPVVAVTDERIEQLDAFFERHDGPFPRAVAMDEYRRSFLAYGVSGTPAYVLVDETGHVVSYSVGYRADTGLPIEGWSWAGREAAAASASD